MKATQAVLAFAGLLGVASASRSDANPLGKVLSLMDDLHAKLTAQGEEEEKAFKEYSHWCVDAIRSKGFEIKTLTSRKESLEANIEKLIATAEGATTKIEELAASIATGTANLNDATAVRDREVNDFAANEKELMGTIDTLGRAIAVISREMAKGGAALTQVDSARLNGLLNTLSALVDASVFSSEDRSKLTALIQAQQNAGDDLTGAPEAASYKSHSAGLVDLLEDLKDKAEQQLRDLRKAETEARHNYEMLKQSLEDQAKADDKDLEEEKASKAAAEQGKATAEGELIATTKDLADAEETLATTEQNCKTTEADHEASVQSRNEELKVIGEATEILQSSTGGAEQQAYSMLQVSQHTAARSQLRSRSDLVQAEVVTMVKMLAQKHHSSALAQLASRIATVVRYGSAGGQDPFAKVRALITDLLAKLQEEAQAEATEKQYCDKETAKTEEKKAELETELSKLTAKIDQAAAKSASLKAEVVQLQEELATLTSEQAEMDRIRQQTHAAYVKAKAELEQGISGVRQALGVLRSYYAAPAMLQQPAMPQGHQKNNGAGGGIIGILEVVESDFAKSLATEEAQESDAQAEYEKTTQENSVTKTIKDKEVQYKTQEAAGLDKTIAELTSDRSTAQEAQAAVLEYYAKLQERCIAKPETYEERAARRADEINGLKEALRVLQDETALVQRRKRGSQSRYLRASQ